MNPNTRAVFIKWVEFTVYIYIYEVVYMLGTFAHVFCALHSYVFYPLMLSSVKQIQKEMTRLIRPHPPQIMSVNVPSRPAEGPGAAFHVAAVSAGLWCSQRVWMLPTTVALLSTLCAAVPLRRHDAGGAADRRCGRWHPHAGQAQRRGGALSEPTPPASPWIQEPGGRDPDDGEEDWGGGWRAVHGLDFQHNIPACLTAACLML